MKRPTLIQKGLALIRNTFLAAGLPALTLAAGAATISWGPAMQITGNPDVLTEGVLLEADAAGSAAAATVNGVTFAAWTGSSTYVVPGPAGYAFQSSGFNAATPPFSNLSAAYQGLLSAGLTFNGSLTLTLTNLTVGDQYEVQVWANDANGDSGGETVDGQTTLFYDNGSVSGEPGSYAIGTFVADGTSQVITFVPANGEAIINALQLRTVPAGTPLVLGIGFSPTNNPLAVSTVTMAGSASGSSLTYQWLSDVADPGTFVSISGATNSALIVNGSGVSATNDYQLVVSNSVGVSTSTVVTLTFVGPPAQGIIWGPPTTISGDSDVNTNGVGLVAYESNIYTNLTVNGVTFTQFLPLDYYTHPENDDYGSPFAMPGVTNGNDSVTLSDANGTVYYWNYGDFPGFGSSLAPFSNLSSNYQAVVAAGIGGTGSDNTLTLVFTNLYPGATYGLQLWDNDSRACCANRVATISDLFGDVVSLAYNTLDAAGGTGNYVLGEGQPDANGTMTVTINAPGYQQLNTFQLRSPSRFPPYLTPVVVAPTNAVYVNSGTAIVISEPAVNPVGSAPAYQWQWDQGTGGTFSDLSGPSATTPSFLVPTNLAVGTYRFQVVVTNLYGTNTTQPVTVSVMPVGPPVISADTQSTFTVYSMAAPLTFGFSVVGLEPLSYQWVSDNGAGNGVFTSVSGATTNSLVINPSDLAANSTYTFELVVSNALATVTSAPVRLIVAGIPQPRPEGFFWGPVASVLGDADVATNGIGVVAFDAAPTAVTLNGVSFSSFAPADAYPLQPGGFDQSGDTDITTNNGTVTTTLSISSGGILYWYDGFSESVAPFSTLSANYQSLLAAGNGDFSNDPWTLEFSGLTPGTEYELQLWVNDSRSAGISRADTVSDGTLQSAPLLFNAQETIGGVGSYVIGTAIADINGDLVVTVEGNGSTQVNAFQLRELPAAVGMPVVNPPQPQTAAEYVGQNGTITFTSAAGGTGPLSYQWIGGVSPATFSPVSGATTNSLTVNATGLTPATYQYSLVVSNASGVTTSSVASFIISGIPNPPAQGFNWGPTAPVVGDTDVRTDGVAVVAFDAAPTAVTLNGVSFSSFAPADAYPLQPGGFSQSADTDITTNNGSVTTTLTISSGGILYWYDGFGGANPPFTSVSTNYQNLLSAGDGDFGNDTWTLQFTGLAPGNAYELQIWADDSRASGIGRNDTLSSASSPNASVSFNTLGLADGTGSFVIGTALADTNGTITIDVTGNFSTQINAFQLRALLPTLSIARSGANVVINWTGGVLEQAPTLLGPWTTNSATSPYTVPAAGTEFYRVKLP